MARRLTKSVIDWVKFAELVPKDQTAHFAALRSKSDNYTRIVHELPESLPAIDFSYYKSNIANPNIAEDFEQKYKALKVSKGLSASAVAAHLPRYPHPVAN